MRTRFPALCAVAMASLAVSAAQGAEVKDPAPPAMLDEKSVAAWVAQNLRGEGWVLVNFDAEGVRLATPSGVSLMSDGLVETDIRHELFTPIEVSAGTARSGLAHWAVDCRARRFAVVSATIYAHNNLQGVVGTRKGDRHSWQEPVASENDTLDAICEAIRTGKRLDGLAVKPAEPS
ncbi:MAG TPA: surface-adhesin E family protein [Phenylobacterium sp.]|nr:surface-adhesin E family protein [Phenylobacterium sp.]